MEEILYKIGIILGSQYVNKPMDNSFLQAIFDDVVAGYNLYEYVSNGISFDEEAPMIFASAAYVEAEKKVKLFDTLDRDAKYEVEVYIENIPENKKIFAANLLKVISLLHELEHVKQKKMIDYDDSYEADLLRMCGGRQEYMSTYGLIPAERLAEGKAIKNGLLVLESSGLIISDLENYLIKKRFSMFYNGYESESFYPLDLYMSKHNIVHSKIGEEEAIHIEPKLETRLYYGWPITAEERDVVRKKAGLKDNKDIIY